MKFVVAPDSYKECLSAHRVALAMQEGILEIFPTAEVCMLPLADGGEGTVHALVTGLNGAFQKVKTVDMYLRPIETTYGVLDQETAVIEVANIIGMEVSKERNPYDATSYGVGDVIKQLMAHGYKRILVGLGGSLTNDGGAGLLEALGIQYFRGNERMRVNGGNLSDITRIDATNLNKQLANTEIRMISDVTNPLLYEQGATYTFGKQKGITDDALQQFDLSINHYSTLLESVFNKQHQQTVGAGAAGGIGYALLMLNATCMPGAEYMIDLLNIDEHIKQADFLITGEGKSDHQTAYGKLPSVIAKRAKHYGVKSILISGSLGDNYDQLYKDFMSINSIMTKPMTLQNAMNNAEALITECTKNIAHMIKSMSDI